MSQRPEAVRTAVVQVERDAPDPAALRHAGRVLRDGGLVAFATETVYGLGADATNADAVRRIFTAKGRPSDNPLIVHVADAAMAQRYARTWPPEARRLSARWPGPLTLVVPRGDDLPPIVSAGLDTVGLRVPAPQVARSLIRAAERPIAAPSANRSEYVSPTCAEHVLADLEGRIDLILDSGPTALGIESTVVDLSDGAPRVLRSGPIELHDLVSSTPASPTAPPRSPGQHPRHYAPRAETVRVDSPAHLDRLPPAPGDLVLAFGVPALPRADIVLPNPQLAAQHLYAALRDADTRGVTRILVVMPPDDPSWRAIRDRLTRATTPSGA